MPRKGAQRAKVTIAAGLRKQYEAGTLTLRQLASLHGVSIATVWRHLKGQGIIRGSGRGRPPSSKTRSLVLDLAAQGVTRRQIADQLGITPEWVRAILADNGVVISTNALNCARCGAVIARGHKACQGNEAALCRACLSQAPDATFGQRLKTVRLALNLSVAQLSAQCGLSRWAIQNYEKGRRVPTRASLRKLASHLKAFGSAAVR